MALSSLYRTYHKHYPPRAWILEHPVQIVEAHPLWCVQTITLKYRMGLAPFGSTLATTTWERHAQGNGDLFWMLLHASKENG